MKKLFTKVVSVALAAAVVVSSAVAPSNKAQAAKKAKVRFNAYCCTSGNFKWIAGDGSSAKLVSSTKTVKKGKKVKVTLTIKGNASKGLQVLTVDSGNSTLKGNGATAGVLKKFKKAKYSKVSVKCDGKKKNVKFQQGYFEKSEKSYSWRLSFFNGWGSQGDTTASALASNAKKLKFKKSCVISFTFVAK